MDAYDYVLPDSSIAQVPAYPRDAARLLDSTGPDGAFCHRRVSELPELLRPGDALVLNETRVIPARIVLEKGSGGRVELLLLEPSVGHGEAGAWEALVRPLRRCPPGTRLTIPGSGNLAAVVGERCGDGTRAMVSFCGEASPEQLGTVALPPYIHTDLADTERYQTVYARVPGSVAAPTAGLHMTEELIEACRVSGATIAMVDLAVGLDTFRPVTAASPEEHAIHTEAYSIPRDTMEICTRARRVVAVGTTAVRALESAAATGELCGRTDLFIYGDFPFRVVDVLMTNFHMPRSSLLLLVEAFCGNRWRDIYREAMSNGYRFLSFGDAMIVGRSGQANR